MKLNTSIMRDLLNNADEAEKNERHCEVSPKILRELVVAALNNEKLEQILKWHPPLFMESPVLSGDFVPPADQIEICEWCEHPVCNGRTHGEDQCFDGKTGEPLPSPEKTNSILMENVPDIPPMEEPIGPKLLDLELAIRGSLANRDLADKAGLTLEERKLLGKPIPRSNQPGQVLDRDSPEWKVAGKLVAADMKIGRDNE